MQDQGTIHPADIVCEQCKTRLQRGGGYIHGYIIYACLCGWTTQLVVRVQRIPVQGSKPKDAA